MVASSNGCPGHRNTAGVPLGGAISDFSKVTRSYSDTTGSSQAHLAAPFAYLSRYVADLVAPVLPLPDSSAQIGEGLDEKRFHVMRLHPPGLGPFHILMDPEDLAGIHDIASQCRFFNEILDLPPVESLAYLPRQALPNLGLLAVPDGFQQVEYREVV